METEVLFDASVQILVLWVFTHGLAVDERRIESESRERGGEFGSHFWVSGYFEEEAART